MLTKKSQKLINQALTDLKNKTVSDYMYPLRNKLINDIQQAQDEVNELS